MRKPITATIIVCDRSDYTHSVCICDMDYGNHNSDIERLSITDHGIMVYGKLGAMGVDLNAVSKADFTNEDGRLYEPGAFVADLDNAYHIEFSRCRAIVYIVQGDQLWKWDSWGDMPLGVYLVQLKAVFGGMGE